MIVSFLMNTRSPYFNSWMSLAVTRYYQRFAPLLRCRYQEEGDFPLDPAEAEEQRRLYAQLQQQHQQTQQQHPHYQQQQRQQQQQQHL